MNTKQLLKKGLDLLKFYDKQGVLDEEDKILIEEYEAELSKLAEQGEHYSYITDENGKPTGIALAPANDAEELSDQAIGEYCDSNMRYEDGSPMCDLQTFYEGAKWARDKMEGIASQKVREWADVLRAYFVGMDGCSEHKKAEALLREFDHLTKEQ